MKERISITIDRDVLKKVKELAQEDNRTLSNFIEKILKSIK